MPQMVTIREASTRLGMHPDTIRRRVARGELRSEKGPRQNDPVLVELPEDAPASVAEAVSGESEVRHLRELLQVREDELGRERRRADEAEERRRKEVDELHVLLQQAQRLLPGSAEAEPMTTPTPGGDAPAPWWRRVFGA